MDEEMQQLQQRQQQPPHQPHQQPQQEEQEMALVASVYPQPHPPLPYDGMLPPDGFARGGREGRGAGATREEGGIENGKEEPKEGVDKTHGLQEVPAPLPPAHMAYMSYPMGFIQPQHIQSPQSPQQQQHQRAYQPAAAAFLPTGEVEEGRDTERGGVACVAHLPSSFPVPTSAFAGHIVQGEREGGRDGHLKDAVERAAEAEGGETFMENDKEVMELFKDGDIESW
jgi:hypothetical protein